MAVSYMDRQALAVLAPTVTADLGISDHAYGWLISAFSFAYLVGAPLAGLLIDRVGARRGLFFAVLFWSIVSAAHATVPNFAVLLALRVALGIAESPSFPGAAQTIHRSLPEHEQPRAFGILFTGSSLGAMIAPPLATYLEHRFNYRIAFLGTALAGLLWIPLWVSLAFRSKARAALDQAHPPDAAPSGNEPQTPKAPAYHLLLNPSVLRGIAAMMSLAPMMAFALNWASKFLVHNYGLKQNQLGIYLMIPPLFFDIGAVAFGHFASARAKALRDGSSPRLLFGLAAVLMTLGAFAFLPASPWGSIAFFSLTMAGGGALCALLSADMLSRVDPRNVSAAGGITAAAQSLAYIIANPLVGTVVESTKGYTWVLIALGLWVIPGALLWLILKAPPLWSMRERLRPIQASATVTPTQ